MQDFLREPVRIERGHPIIGKNSGVFAKADPLGVNSDGFLETVSAGQKILGYALEDKTCTATNQTVAKYKPEYIPAEGVEMQITADAAVTDALLAGQQYKDFGTVTSGAFVIALANITGGQVKLIGYDPNNDGTTTLAICVASELLKDGYAQA